MKERLNQLFPLLRKVGILGAGISGKGCACLCDKLGIAYDLLDETEKFSEKPHLKNYDLCITSPGFAPHHPWIQVLQKQSIPHVTEIDFAALCLKNPMIAVTGTNGKTSVTEALAQILCLAGKPACAAGNNGTVLSELTAKGLNPETIVVCEISSYQAWQLRYLKPMYTLWTNIDEDHIAYHENFRNYFEAKANLLKLTQTFAICGSTLQPYLKNNPKVIFADSHEKLADWLAQFPLCYSRGQCENFALLKTFAEVFGISPKVLETGLKTFKQSPHRLHCCLKKEGYEFWNDSKGTNLHAVKAALKSLKNKTNIYWILGGRSKGENVKTFPEVFNCFPNVKKIFLIGESGKELAKDASLFKTQLNYVVNLEGVFANLKHVNPPATIVLSPGFSSWDQFSSYAERGNLFENLAQTFTLG